MAENEGREAAIKELKTALELNDGSERDFHIRQAIQLLELNGETNPEENTE